MALVSTVSLDRWTVNAFFLDLSDRHPLFPACLLRGRELDGCVLKVWMDRRFSLRGTGAGWIRRNIRQIWPEKTVGLLAQDLENGWIVPRVTLLLERWLWWRV